MINRVRGTQDILDLKLYNFVLNTIKHHLDLHNFSEIETPVLELTELFVRSIGAETDVVSKEMYTINTSDDESICLRPEGTASIIRAYVENGVQQSPWKVYMHGPMFRRERPQKGRWRQFNQFTFEVINAQSIAHDAHVIGMLNTLFGERFKLDNYVVKINFLGCSDDRKQHRTALVDFLNKEINNICETCKVRKDKNPLRVFDCKSEQCQACYTKAPKITEHLCTACAEEWQTLQELLGMLSVSFVIEPLLVRGLDYYNKTVFEFSSPDLGAQSAFLGGGRYSLGKEVGAKDDFACIGAGIGMGRIMLLIEKNLQKISIPQEPALHVVIPLGKEQIPLALLLATEIQAHGLSMDVLLEQASVSNLMKKANKLGAKFVCLIGADEQTNGTITVKNMIKGESTTMRQAELISFLSKN